MTGTKSLARSVPVMHYRGVGSKECNSLKRRSKVILKNPLPTHSPIIPSGSRLQTPRVGFRDGRSVVRLRFWASHLLVGTPRSDPLPPSTQADSTGRSGAVQFGPPGRTIAWLGRLERSGSAGQALWPEAVKSQGLRYQRSGIELEATRATYQQDSTDTVATGVGGSFALKKRR